MNKIKCETYTNDNGIKFKIINNTAYHEETPDQVVTILDNAISSKYRVRLHYGDVKTGRDWQEIYDIEGYIGRSTGTLKIPLLVHNSRSLGGGAILDHCIVKITTTRKPRRTLYQHPDYHIADESEVIISELIEVILRIGEEVQAI